MSIILRVDGLLGKITGTVYGEQVNFSRPAFLTNSFALRELCSMLVIGTMQIDIQQFIPGK
jgi:hypothetical protein